MPFPTFKKKIGVKKNSGGGDLIFFIFRKTIHSHFTFYAIFNIKKNNIEKCPFTYWLNGKWFLQIVDRGCWNLYIYFFRKTILSHFTFYAIFNIKKIILKSAPSFTG